MFMLTLSKKSLRRAGLLVLGGVLCCGVFVGANYAQAQTAAAGAPEPFTVASPQDIQTYFTGYAIAIDLTTVTADKVKVPRSWDDSFSAFNGVVAQSGQDLSAYKGKTVEKWLALVPANSTGKEEQYAVLLVYKEKVVGAYLLSKPSGVVTGLSEVVQTQVPVEIENGLEGENANIVSSDDVCIEGEDAQQEALQEEVSLDVQLELDVEGYPVE